MHTGFGQKVELNLSSFAVQVKFQVLHTNCCVCIITKKVASRQLKYEPKYNDLT